MTKKPVKMTQLADDPILTLEIPKVEVLCLDLGFIEKDSQKKFRASVTNWRKGYRTAAGKKGTALLDWDSEDERYDLGMMAQGFLESGRNAHDFWPSDGGPSAQVSPRSPNDKVEILQLLRRFMWRQNKYLEANNRRGNNSINGDGSGSEEEYFPLSPSQTLQPSPQAKRQSRFRPAVDASIAKDLSSYNAATGLRPNSAREMGDLLMDNRNRYGLPESKPFALPESLPASTGHASGFRPGVTDSALTNGSPGLSLTREDSASNEESRQSQSSRQTRSDPRLLGGSGTESESNKRIHASMPVERDGTSLQRSIPVEPYSTALQTPTDSPSVFHPGDANSTLTTDSSGPSLTRGSSAVIEENTQSQSLRQKRSSPRLSGRNDSESESTKRRRISMLPEPQSISSPTLASGLEASNDLKDQPNHSRRNVQLGNSDSSKSQPGPSPRESSHPTTAQADPHTHTPAIRPKVDIRVVDTSSPRLDIKKWPGGTLKDRTLKSIFDDVSSMFSEQTLQTIKFKLQTLKKENGMECVIERDDDGAYDLMMQKFNERVRERVGAGETRFKLVLEPERGAQGATEGAVNGASGSEENYL